MELLVKLNLFLHIAAGGATLLAGPAAIFYNFKNVRNHRRAGKVFFYAMLVVCFSAIASYFRHPDVVFFQFLLGISVLVLAGVLRGVRAVRFMHGARAGAFDYAYTVFLGACAFGMLSMAVTSWKQGAMLAFPILFGVFGASAAGDTVKNLRLFARFDAVDKNTWYRLHVSTMLGAFTASTTAFTVNAAHFLPWYLQWFGPTLLILPLQIYFGRKLRSRTAPRGLVREGISSAEA